jgi:predicted 3-demethylubiquinone-9 3-methyltransferase (glyoxalase superfamily)
MFQGNGSAALEFYRSIFPDAKVEEIECYGPREAGPEGSIKRARFSIGGQSVLCTDGSVKHASSFTPSFSFFVEPHSENQVRSRNDVLKEGGQELMPIGSYGFSTLFAWVTDRLGRSWQLNCA